MKTISAVIDEIAEEQSPAEIVDPRFKNAVRKIVKLACVKFQEELIIDVATQKPKSGVSNELVRRCLEFMEAK